jgi:hypothetical protein
MKTLAEWINLELEQRHECGVYEEELTKLWPIFDKDRKAKIEQFAVNSGFRLGFYKTGLCAIFTKAA